MNILDANGQPAKPLDGPIEILAPHAPLEAPKDSYLEKMEQDLLGKVIEMPVHANVLERRTKIKQLGERRAIEMLFETVLDGPRVNLLMLRIFVAAENAEREVLKLPDAMVARLVKEFEDRAARAQEEAPEAPDGATP